MKRALVSNVRNLYWTATRFIGLEHTHGRGTAENIQATLAFLFWPIYASVAAILENRRFFVIATSAAQVERIGHFAVDIDTYLKMNLLKGRDVRTILLCPWSWKPNEALLNYWSKHLIIVRNEFLVLLLRPLLRFPAVATPLLHLGMTGWQSWNKGLPFEARLGACPVYDTQGRWGTRPPLLTLTERDIQRGTEALRDLGFPSGSWFVCIHCREPGYAPQDETTHSFRNARIQNFYAAIDAIARRGGWCIRMGDKTMSPAAPHPRLIDYALSKHKSDWMDVFLCAKCEFLLGTSSGLFCVSGVFGRPSALTNMTPPFSWYSLFPRDLSIPKLIVNADGKAVDWPTLFASEASHYRLTGEFALAGLDQTDNPDSEIEELAIEMVDRLEGSFEASEDDLRLQSRFKDLVQTTHYCYGAASSIGRDFLRRHRALLD